MDLDGKVALVTGGASGLGLATGRRLARAGCRVVLTDIAAEAGEKAAAELDADFAPLDVTDPAAWTAVVNQVQAQHGGLDIAHLNAGVALGVADLTELTDEQYRLITDVNFGGVVFGVRAVLAAMRDGGGLVATASLGGLTPMPTDPIYSATKHAVVALMRSIAPTLQDRGITANAVCPGFADTPMASEFREAIAQYKVPLVDPEAVAEAVERILVEGVTGEAWFVQPGREAGAFQFRNVPGPR